MGCCFSEPVDLDGEVSLFHFDLHRVIGKGALGKVQVVEHKCSNKFYALKYINKTQCVHQQAVPHVIQERQLLEEVDHPFIVKLRYAFQDDRNLYFVLDLMLGGDLQFHLGKIKQIPEDYVRFWIAEVSCALDYLHRREIVHRDIKPHNILLDSMGHAHITDFNTAIHYSKRRLHTSLAGTMAYMAPEVIRKEVYSWQVDWWSLGVTTYELLFHKLPFNGRNAEKMTQSILQDSLIFPEAAFHQSSAAISALKEFIDRDPHTRLCCGPSSQGLEGIRQHPWFMSFDWDALERKDCPPPFVPDINQANFDMVAPALDEFFFAQNPLTHSKRKANPNLEKMKPESRKMEKDFTVYDFSRMAQVTEKTLAQQLE